MSEASFIIAILAAPEDDGLRLVFADWLEEQGGLRAHALRMPGYWLRGEQSVLLRWMVPETKKAAVFRLTKRKRWHGFPRCQVKREVASYNLTREECFANAIPFSEIRLIREPAACNRPGDRVVPGIGWVCIRCRNRLINEAGGIAGFRKKYNVGALEAPVI